MDLLDGGSCVGRDLSGPSAAGAALLVPSLLLLQTLLLHTERTFSLVALFLLLSLLLARTRGRRLRWDQQTLAVATLDGARRLALLWLRVQSLRHFGALFAFLLDQLSVLLRPQQLWTSADKTRHALLLLGLLLVAGVNAQEYGALLHTLLLLGMQLGLQLAAETPVLRAAAAADETLLAQAAAAGFAALLGLLTPESVVMAQRVANDRATEDGGVMSTARWTLYLVAAVGCQVAAGHFQQKQRSLPSTAQAKAQVASNAAGMLLAIGVAAWEGGWLRCILDIPACGVVLYVLMERWRSAGGGTSAHSESYLDTYRTSVSELHVEPGMFTRASHVLGVLWSKRSSRQLLMFLSANVAFMFVELGVGIYTNSLGLMGDAGHMLFDNAALVIGLVASYIGQLPPDDNFTYGYGRVEVLSGFLNSLLLLVVSFHLLTEAASRFLDPPEVSTDHLLLTSTAGLVVNLVGLFWFHDHVHGHSHSHGVDPEHSGSCGGHGHSHGNSHHQSHGEDASEAGDHGGNSNMYGVYLHVLADTLGSVGVIISSVLIQMYGWNIADSASSALISLLILGSTLPLLKDTARQLLQGAPQELQDKINAALRDVQAQVPGVERIARWNIWHHAGGVSVATLHLEVASSADEQRVLQQTQSIFRRYARLDKFLSVQISKPQVIATMEPESLGSDQSMAISACTSGHSHGHNDGHGHSHGVEASLEAFSAFPVQPQQLHIHSQNVPAVTSTMSTHENPASDDLKFITTPPVKPDNHGDDHSHGLQYHPVSAPAVPPAPFQYGQQRQRRQQVTTGFAGAQRW